MVNSEKKKIIRSEQSPIGATEKLINQNWNEKNYHKIEKKTNNFEIVWKIHLKINESRLAEPKDY